jgi:hypothetical protein
VERLSQFLKQQHRAWLYAEALTLTIPIAFVDYITGPEVWRYAISDRHFDSEHHRLVDG